MKKPKSTVAIVASVAEAEAIEPIIKPNYEVVIILAPVSIDRLRNSIEESGACSVVIDSGTNDYDWVSAVYTLTLSTRPRVIVIGKSNKADILSAFREGAVAYLLKSSLHENLLPALETVEEGRVYYRQEDAKTIQEHMLSTELGSARNVGELENGISLLSVREKEVFPLLAEGLSIKETARILGVSPKTIETHKYHIMQKLHLHTMADFTKLAMSKDLIPL